MISAGPGKTSVGGETKVPLEYAFIGVPDTHVSQESPRLNHDDQLRQQPVLVAAIATTIRTSSLFMAFLTTFQDGGPRSCNRARGLGDVKLYITVDEVQLRAVIIFHNPWHRRHTL